MPQYRGRNWNGEIHLYDHRKQIYVGLLDKIVSFVSNMDTLISLKIINFMDNHLRLMKKSHMKVSRITCILFVLILPGKYQIEGVYDALKT
jgi:hypothetical protein